MNLSREIRASLAAAVTIAACLGGCGSASVAEQSLGSSPQTAPVNQAQRGGVVFLGVPRAASIVVIDSKGQEIFQTRATETGNFLLPALDFQNRLKIVATLEDGKRLEKVSDGTDYLWIDVISHLTSLYLTDHPDLSVHQAEQAVRQGLSIPDGVGTNGASNLLGSPFSSRIFLEQAARAGGFDAYCRQVLSQIETGQVLSFRASPFLSPKLLARQSVAFQGVRPLGVFDVAKLIGETAGGDALSFGVDSLMSAGFAAIGINIGTASHLQEIQDTLNEIENQLTALSNLIITLNVVDDYKTAYDAIGTITTSLQSFSDTLAVQAHDASASNSTDPNTYDHGPAAVPSAITDLMQAQLATSFETQAHQVIGYLTNTTADENIVLLYNQLLAKQVYPQPQFNKAQHFFYSFRQDNWTVGTDDPTVPPPPVAPHNLQANLDYARSAAVSAMNLWSENAQLSILPSSLLKGLSAPADALNQARSGGGNDGILKGEMDLQAAQNQVPYPFGCSQVFVDLAQNKMWYLQYMDGSIGPIWSQAQGHLTNFKLCNWTAAPYPSISQAQAAQTYTGTDDQHPSGPSGGWRFPTARECVTLRNLAGASDQFGLKKLGFNVPSGSNNRIHLYGTPQHTGGLFEPFNYYSFDWKTGSTHIEGSDDSGPNWNYMYVRNIPDFQSGDSADVVHNCYGFLPDYIDFNLSGGALIGRGSTVAGVQNAFLNVFGGSNSQPANSGLSILTQNTQLTSSNPEILDFSPTGTGSVSTHWHGPGTVTVTATRRGAPATIPAGGASNTTLQTLTSSFTMTSPLTGADSFSSVQISPYNSGLDAAPLPGGTREFFLLGFYTGGGVVDLTQQPDTQWVALTDATPPTTLDPTIASFSTAGVSRGTLTFGSNASGHRTIVIQCTYQNQVHQARLKY